MKAFGKHSDSIFLILIIFALMIGAGVMYSQWQVVEGYWATNFDVHSENINPHQIISVPSGRDSMIMPIDEPLFAHVSIVEQYFSPVDPVIVIDAGNEERAYPLQILATHAIVNDHIADIPIAVTFCALCNSAVVYQREIDGHALRMGVSGNFYGNNFLMYDDLTESWWYQLTGEAVVGDYTGRFLEIVPSQVVGFQSYVTHYPDGLVLVGDANQPNINYQLSTLRTYQTSREPLLYHGDYDTRLSSMERVLSINIDDVPIAYPFSTLQDIGVINDMIAEYAIVIFWMPGVSTQVNGETLTEDYGQAAAFGRVLDGETLTFYAENGRIYDSQTHSEWNIFGEAIAGELMGKSLPDVQCFTHFWFAWSSAYPDTLLFGDY